MCFVHAIQSLTGFQIRKSLDEFRQDVPKYSVEVFTTVGLVGTLGVVITKFAEGQVRQLLASQQ